MSSRTKAVSIVIPTFNEVSNLEIIISNNGSTDETYSFLEKISKEDKRIKRKTAFPRLGKTSFFFFKAARP